LPSKNNIRENVTFNINGTHYANTYRRVLLDELYAYYLDFELGAGNIITDDAFILDDMIKDRLNMLIINQPDNNLVDDRNPFSKHKFEIDVTNDTTEVIYITASDITGSGVKLVFAEHTRIIGLNPRCSIKIKNIVINKRRIKEDGKLSLVSNFNYVPLTVKGGGAYSDDMKSSITEVEKYEISFRTFGVKGTVILDNANTYLRNKLKMMKDLGDNQFNISMEMFVDGNVHIFRYMNIDYTECNLIVSYIMDKYPDFPFCNFEKIHPSKEEFNIIIKHKDAVKILHSAIDGLIKYYTN
jgi:DNA-directed RNA polymerase subunit L